MNLRNLLALNSPALFAFGLLFIIRPFQKMAMYETTPSGWGVTGLLSATLIGFSVVLWSIRSVLETPAKRTIVRALFLANLTAFLISMMQQRALWNTIMGGMTVGIYLGFVIAYGYVLRTKPIDLRRPVTIR